MIRRRTFLAGCALVPIAPKPAPTLARASYKGIEFPPPLTLADYRERMGFPREGLTPEVPLVRVAPGEFVAIFTDHIEMRNSKGRLVLRTGGTGTIEGSELRVR
ncbi:MAG TPA: hypothetical protein VHO25_14530 [Polyangiaceae bacterium]|nr:hypothetical protein [Polyangiaceae bacterium]